MNLITTYLKWRGKKLKPGQKCPISGVYRQICDDERCMAARREATCVKGEPMPPTTYGHHFWQLIDAANVDEAKV